MDPRLKSILQKAKAIDQAARKYDTVDHTVLEQRVNSKTNSAGLMDQVVGGSTPSYQPIDVYSENYKEKVSTSKLPPEIQRAMMENPIPQASMVDQLTEEDEWDIQERSKNVVTKKRKVIEESITPKSEGITTSQVRKMIAEEIAKALPGIIENYFDKKVIQENMRIMKHVIKNSQK